MVGFLVTMIINSSYIELMIIVTRKKAKVLLLLLVLLPGTKRLWYVMGINLPILLAEISVRENKIPDINDRLPLE
jgi:hypothetical protein